jgi:hypothetical protein
LFDFAANTSILILPDTEDSTLTCFMPMVLSAPPCFLIYFSLQTSALGTNFQTSFCLILDALSLFAVAGVQAGNNLGDVLHTILSYREPRSSAQVADK